MGDAVEVVKDVKDDTSNWWNKLPKEVRDIVLVSAGVLGGIALVYVADAYSGDASEEEVTEDVPVLEEMKEQMNAANKLAKSAKKMAKKAIKNADKAITAMNRK